MLPNAVDHHPRRQRMLGAGQPAGQLQAATGAARGGRAVPAEARRPAPPENRRSTSSNDSRGLPRRQTCDLGCVVPSSIPDIRRWSAARARLVRLCDLAIHLGDRLLLVRRRYRARSAAWPWSRNFLASSFCLSLAPVGSTSMASIASRGSAASSAPLLGLAERSGSAPRLARSARVPARCRPLPARRRSFYRDQADVDVLPAGRLLAAHRQRVPIRLERGQRLGGDRRWLIVDLESRQPRRQHAVEINFAGVVMMNQQLQLTRSLRRERFGRNRERAAEPDPFFCPLGADDGAGRPFDAETRRPFGPAGRVKIRALPAIGRRGERVAPVCAASREVGTIVRSVGGGKHARVGQALADFPFGLRQLAAAAIAIRSSAALARGAGNRPVPDRRRPSGRDRLRPSCGRLSGSKIASIRV